MNTKILLKVENKKINETRMMSCYESRRFSVTGTFWFECSGTGNFDGVNTPKVTT
jgi:hypothetical protein